MIELLNVLLMLEQLLECRTYSFLYCKEDNIAAVALYFAGVDSCGSDEALLSEAIRLSLEGHEPQELTGVDAQERTRSRHPSSLMQPSEF